MIIKVIASKPKPKGIERYARYLANYIADGDRRWLQPDAIGMDHGLTLAAYMTSDKEAESPRERVLFRGAWIAGTTQDWGAGLQEVERRLAKRSRKVKKPVRHSILSCRADESLSEQQCDDAVAIMARELGCEGAVILWAAHADTDNFHLHAMFVTVDAETGAALPFGQEADGRAGYKEALQRAIARIEQAHQLQPEAGARYEMQGDVPVRKPASQPVMRKRTPLRQEVFEWEETSGFASLTRYAQDVAGPILDDAESWPQLHRALAPHGLGIRRSVNGGVLHAGEEQVKLSNVDRRHSWEQLKKRFGEFESAVDIEIAAYTPRVLDQVKAGRWLDRSQKLREVSEQVDRRVAALMAARSAALAEVDAQVSAYRADLAGFDGDPRLQRDLATAWPRLRAAAAAAVRSAFDGRIDAVRALRRAAASCDDVGAIDIGALGIPDVGIVSPWHADRASPSSVALPGFDAERRGDVVCYWSIEDRSRRGQPAMVDTGPIIWVNDRSDRAIEAALTLARARFGDVAVFGDAAYLRQCRRAAERLGMDIEVITVREARRRARRTRSEVESARRRAGGADNNRRANTVDRLQAWARVYRRATPQESPPGWGRDTSAGVQHHTALPAEPERMSERRRPRDAEVAKSKVAHPIAPGRRPAAADLDRSWDRSI